MRIFLAECCIGIILSLTTLSNIGHTRELRVVDGLYLTDSDGTIRVENKKMSPLPFVLYLMRYDTYDEFSNASKLTKAKVSDVPPFQLMASNGRSAFKDLTLGVADKPVLIPRKGESLKRGFYKLAVGRLTHRSRRGLDEIYPIYSGLSLSGDFMKNHYDKASSLNHSVEELLIVLADKVRIFTWLSNITQLVDQSNFGISLLAETIENPSGVDRFFQEASPLSPFQSAELINKFVESYAGTSAAEKFSQYTAPITKLPLTTMSGTMSKYSFYAGALCLNTFTDWGIMAFDTISSNGILKEVSFAVDANGKLTSMEELAQQTAITAAVTYSHSISDGVTTINLSPDESQFPTSATNKEYLWLVDHFAENGSIASTEAFQTKDASFSVTTEETASVLLNVYADTPAGKVKDATRVMLEVPGPRVPLGVDLLINANAGERKIQVTPSIDISNLSDIREITYSWGDGSSETYNKNDGGVEFSKFHTYASAGTYTVKVGVISVDDRLTLISQEVTVSTNSGGNVGPPTGNKPVITSTTPSTNAIGVRDGQVYKFTVRASDANEDIDAIRWEKDGNIIFEGSPSTITKTTYVASHEKDSASSSEYFEVTGDGNPITVTATVLDDGNNSTSYTWKLYTDFGTHNPNLSLSTPTGGEVWRKGTSHTIAWDSPITDRDEDMRIELLRGSQVIDVIKSARRVSYLDYVWNIPQDIPSGDGYKVRLTLLSDTSIVDESTFPFSIVDVNTPPECKAVNIRCEMGASVSIELPATDVNDDPLSFALSSQPALGSAVIEDSSRAIIKYTAGTTPGVDTFYANMSDDSTSSTAQITVEVVDPAYVPDYTLQSEFSSTPVNSLALTDSVIYVGGRDKVTGYKPDGTVVQTLESDGTIYDIAIEGTTLVAVSGSDDGYVYNLSNGSLLHTLVDHGSNVYGVAIKDGRIYSVGDVREEADAYIRVWNAATGGLIQKIPGSHDSNHLHEKDINDVAVGTGYIFTASDDEDVRSWKIPSGDRGDRFSGPADMLCVAATSDRVIYGDEEGNIIVSTYDDHEEYRVKHAPGSYADVQALVVIGNEIISGGEDGYIRVRNLENGELKQEWKAHSDVRELATNGDLLVSGGADGTVKTWARHWNNPPLPSARNIVTYSGTTASTTVAANDPDEEDTHTFTISASPQYGQASLNNEGVLTYTANDEFVGSDEITVTVQDNWDRATSLVVKITVLELKPTAVISGGTGITNTGEMIFLDGSASTNPTNYPLEYAWLLTTPEGSSCELYPSPDQTSAIFTSDVTGIYTVMLEVTANNIKSLQAYKEINITNTTPQVDSEAYSANATIPYSGKITVNDPDDESPFFEVVMAPSYGTLTVDENGEYIYTPHTSLKKTDSAIVVISDAAGASKYLTLYFTPQRTVNIMPIIFPLLSN